MKNIFKAEAIGLDPATERAGRTAGILRELNRQALPWVAELTAWHRVDGYTRRRLKPKADYTHANAKGTRGVWLYWTLECGPVYEARYRTSWTEWHHRFLVVTAAGEIKDATEEEVRGWLANVCSALTS